MCFLRDTNWVLISQKTIIFKLTFLFLYSLIFISANIFVYENKFVGKITEAPVMYDLLKCWKIIYFLKVETCNKTFKIQLCVL
jgi:hypothetical protein